MATKVSAETGASAELEETVLADEEDRVGLKDLLAAAVHASESSDRHEGDAGAVFYSDEEFVAHLESLVSEQPDA